MLQKETTGVKLFVYWPRVLWTELTGYLIMSHDVDTKDVLLVSSLKSIEQILVLFKLVLEMLVSYLPSFSISLFEINMIFSSAKLN